MTKAPDRPPSFLSRSSLATDLGRCSNPVRCINGVRGHLIYEGKRSKRMDDAVPLPKP